MGLYHLHIRQGAAEAVIQVATESGISFTRVVKDQYGTHHFFKRPKQNREAMITIWKDKKGEEYLLMGVSAWCHSLAKRLDEAGLIIPSEITK